MKSSGSSIRLKEPFKEVSIMQSQMMVEHSDLSFICQDLGPVPVLPLSRGCP